MKYEILDPAEREASAEFYKAYFYGSGDLSLLLNHLETWPTPVSYTHLTLPTNREV